MPLSLEPMSDLDLQIRSIQEKLQQLLKQQALLQKENGRLKKELDKARQAAADSVAQVHALQQQVDAARLGSGQMNETERAALDKRIDVYLKEIDKCLAMLNT